MRILVDEDLAMERLISMCQANVSPVLTPGELQDCLDDARVAFVWAASTNYATLPHGHGLAVIPSAAKRNGHLYELVKFATTGTTSGATEPNWPETRDSEIKDGDLTWREVGSELDSLWDMPAAARAAWLLKAGKVAQCTDFSQDGVSFSSSHLYDHCMRQALEAYSSVYVA
jgi:hypothetical protein